MVYRGQTRRQRVGSLRVGFVGAGRMGFPMVERLAAAGHDLVVYARRPEAAADLGRLGVAAHGRAGGGRGRRRRAAAVRVQRRAADRDRRAAGRRAAGRRRVRLPRDRPGVGAAVAGRPLPRHPRGGRAGERRPASSAAAGWPSCSAASPRPGRAAEAVRAYADPVIETGELGTALAVKLVNNFLFAANTQVLAEAVWLGEAARGGSGEMLSALNHMSGGSQVSRAPRSGPTWPRSPPGSARS